MFGPASLFVIIGPNLARPDSVVIIGMTLIPTLVEFRLIFQQGEALLWNFPTRPISPCRP